mmetsp:Transcript_2219/g.4547  ORF Transcript_2219/g.4547 Transcript_2219/m.4547 type:complete len:91 (+) Transcript_2219:156-428(+)
MIYGRWADLPDSNNAFRHFLDTASMSSVGYFDDDGPILVQVHEIRDEVPSPSSRDADDLERSAPCHKSKRRKIWEVVLKKILLLTTGRYV